MTINQNKDIYIQTLLSDNAVKKSDILEYVKSNYKDIKLKPKTLGLLFEAYVDVIGWKDEDKRISPIITIDDLLEINVGYKSENGCQWARSDDSSYLGRNYIIERKLQGGSVYSIQLKGINKGIKKYRSIRKDIVDKISKQRCAILDIGTRIEVDHKNGRYDDKRVADIKTQRLDDFQPLCKTANDAKRHHCDVCIDNAKRYNAKRLGYKEGWLQGNEQTSNCIGCYWYDPKRFNEVISKDFKKK